MGLDRQITLEMVARRMMGAQRQGRTRLAQDFSRQFLIIDQAGKQHCADHGRPGGNCRAPHLARRVALRRGTEMIDRLGTLSVMLCRSSEEPARFPFQTGKKSPGRGAGR
jgi:hypothetical protein